MNPFPANDASSPQHETHSPWKRWRVTVVGTAVLVSMAAIIAFLIWASRRPVPFAELEPEGFSVNCLAFHPDGQHLIVGSPSRHRITMGLDPGFLESELSVWNVVTRTKLHSVPTPQRIRSLSLTRNGDLLAVAIGAPREETPNWVTDGKPRGVRIYSFPEMKELHKLESERYINSVALSPDGKLLATASNSDTRRGPCEVKVWDVGQLTLKYALEDFSHTETQIRFSRDGKTLAVLDYLAGKARAPFEAEVARIRLHDAETGKPVKQTEFGNFRNGPPKDFYFSADEQHLIVEFMHDGRFSLVGIAAGTENRFGDARHASQRRKTAISADGKWLLSAANRDSGRPKQPPEVVIWDLEANKLLEKWVPKDLRSVGPIAISPDKKTLAIGSDKVYLFDLTRK